MDQAQIKSSVKDKAKKRKARETSVENAADQSGAETAEIPQSADGVGDYEKAEKKRKKEAKRAKRSVEELEESQHARDTSIRSTEEQVSTETGIVNEASSEKARRRAEKEARRARKAAVKVDIPINTEADIKSHVNGKENAAESGSSIRPAIGSARTNEADQKKCAATELAATGLKFTMDTTGAASSAAQPAERPNMKRKKEKLELLAHNKIQSSAHDPNHIDHKKYTEHPELSKLPDTEISEFLQKNSIVIADPQLSPLRPLLDFYQLPPTDLYCHYVISKFKKPTPIQSASWPFAFAGRDVVGVAETGSGKTLAFGLPLARHIKGRLNNKESHPKIRRSPMALVLTPTRELALQIHEEIAKLGASNAFNCALAYGGTDKNEQIGSMKKVHVIIATPGRLKDYIAMGKWDGVLLDRCKYVVLDEADRMLDKGFEDDVKDILGGCPNIEEGRQTLMYTATWPQSIQNLASTYMKDPVKITLGGRGEAGSELRANEKIKQVVEVIRPEEKQYQLKRLLRKYTNGRKNQDRILVFCLYKKEAARIEGYIRDHGYNVGGIHGDLSQPARTAALGAFREGTVPILVATDVAARGLDIPDVKLVLNYTFPLTAEDYVHRIGRTGRAGEDGLAVTLFTEHEKGLAGALVNVMKAAKQEVPEELLKFGGTVKKKGHNLYGAFTKEGMEGQTGTKITFD